MAEETKRRALSELQGGFAVSAGQPVMFISGQIKDVEYAKTGWKGSGDSMEEYELPRDEWHTRVDVVWIGGNRRVKLPPNVGDVTKEITVGSPVLVVAGYQDKRGQLKPDAKRVEIVGFGISRYDPVFQNHLLTSGEAA